MRQTTITLLALALATGCVKENDLFEPTDDGGADADADTDTDTDTDTDGDTDTCEDGAYLACLDDDVYWFDSCDGPGELFDDCDDEHGTCVDLSATEAECGCVDHFDLDDGCESCEGNWDLASDCTTCVEGFGGEGCAVCELGFSGESCDACDQPGYADFGDGCEYILTCGTDWVWLVDGAPPPADRDESEFTIGGTTSEPTVQDTVTGLEWRRCLEGMTWSGLTCEGSAATLAADAISTLCGDGYGELEDWRLPDVTELGTILDLGSTPPVLDDLFPGFGQPAVWTEDDCPVDATDNWAVLFFGGAIEGIAYDSRVLCVRGGQPVAEPDEVPPRFAVQAAEGSTVRDNWSGLEWRRCTVGQIWDGTACLGTPAAYDWDAAQLACQGEYAGHDDWTLPEVPMLRSVANYCAEDPATFATGFPGLLAEPYWSATPVPSSSNASWVDFASGEQNAGGGGTELRVLCARQAD